MILPFEHKVIAFLLKIALLIRIKKIMVVQTNNDLEQTFGVLRHHQRRCTGRKVAPSSLVIRGKVQLPSAIATALYSLTAQDLAQVCVQTWQQLRSDLRQHQLSRIEQLRFRRNLEAYLATLEKLLL